MRQLEKSVLNAISIEINGRSNWIHYHGLEPACKRLLVKLISGAKPDIVRAA
jgi:hypothetical protein